MSNYVHGTSLSYADYLQAQSFEASFKSEISKQARAIIASNEELQREHISIAQATSAGVENLSFQAQEISGKLDELNATFQWGFNNILLAINRVNDALSELVAIAKTPEKTWAYEQFDIAREAFRKGLYEEALEYLNRAINGDQGHTGYKIDHRFHFLLGIIRLGDVRNTDQKIVDLHKALVAFYDAARLAADNKESGRAMLAAGWAAYCEGNLPLAIEYTKWSIQQMPDLAEGHFQLAKFLMHGDDPDHAIPSLRTAIELDRGYTIKAAGDGDFQRHEDKLEALLEDLRREAKEKTERISERVRQILEDGKEIVVRGYSFALLGNLAPVKDALNEVNALCRRNTYYGYLDAFPLIERAERQLREARAAFDQYVDRDVKDRISSLSAKQQIARKDIRSKWGCWISVIVAGFFILSFVAFANVSFADPGKVFYTWFFAFFLLIVLAIVAVILRVKIVVAKLEKEKKQITG